MRFYLRLSSLLLIVCATPIAALAAPSESPNVHSTERRTVSSAQEEGWTQSWYGAHTLAVGLPSVAALALARTDGSDHTRGWLAIPGYVGATFGAPIVHWSHGQLGKGFVSLFLATSSMVAFGKLLPRGCDPDADAPFGEERCAGNARMLVPRGVPIGALVAVAVDAAFLSWKPVPKSHSSVLPYFTVGDRGAMAGMQGHF